MVAAKLRHRAQRWFIAMVVMAAARGSVTENRAMKLMRGQASETPAISVGPIFKELRLEFCRLASSESAEVEAVR